MIAIRKAWWATLLLTAFVGCTPEEPAGDNPAPPPPLTSDSAPPPATPSIEAAPEKPKEAAPEAELPKEVEAPKVEPPKEAGDLKLDAPAVTPPAEAKEEPKKDEAANKTKLSADELAELASLTPADKELALKQLVCPVSGENLGSMGAPLKVNAEGKDFLICCEGCSKEVKANGKEVVAKLKK